MRRRILTALTALLLTPTLALAQKVSYDFDKTAGFRGFKTYAKKDGTKVGQQLIDDRIVAAIDEQLAAKGFKKVDANPDVVSFITSRSTKRRTSRLTALAMAADTVPTGMVGEAVGERARRRPRCGTF